MNSIDPLKLQRLIDGELDSSDVQEILREASDSPKQWEAIATGFVENQIWSQAVCTDANPESMTNGFSVPQNSSDLVEVKKNKTGVPPRIGFPWQALVASMMLAAMLGYGINQVQNRGIGKVEPLNSIVDNESLKPRMQIQTPKQSIPDAVVAQNEDESEPGFTQANYHFEIPKDNERLNELVGQPGEPVPLYRVENAQQWQAINRKRNKALPPELIKRFTGSGYQMMQDVELISGKLGDGRTFVIPVQTIRFLPNQ